MVDAKIRRYRKRDREAVLQITRESFGGACLDSNIEAEFGAIGGASWQQRKCESIDWDLYRNAEHTFVAEADGHVVGYACTRFYRDRAIGHIANMAVDEEHQGRGIGKKLVRAALEHFRRCGMHYARIETLQQNYKGMKLYPSFGFKEVGRQVYYFLEL